MQSVFINNGSNKMNDNAIFDSENIQIIISVMNHSNIFVYFTDQTILNFEKYKKKYKYKYKYKYK